MTSFVSTWLVVTAIKIPIKTTITEEVLIDWGDETQQTLVPGTIIDDGILHMYNMGGDFFITITGKLQGWSFKEVPGSESNLISITSWGGLELYNSGGQFQNCFNLISFPTTGNKLLMPADCSNCFSGCDVLSGGLNSLNTENVTDMSTMFSGCFNFNEDISNWNVQNVTNMQNMFSDCNLFKKDLSKWILRSISADINAPSFTDEYINDVKPKFSSEYKDAWKFNAPVTQGIINVIIPVNSRTLYAMDGLRLINLAYKSRRRGARFSSSAIVNYHNSRIVDI